MSIRSKKLRRGTGYSSPARPPVVNDENNAPANAAIEGRDQLTFSWRAEKSSICQDSHANDEQHLPTSPTVSITAPIDYLNCKPIKQHQDSTNDATPSPPDHVQVPQMLQPLSPHRSATQYDKGTAPQVAPLKIAIPPSLFAEAALDSVILTPHTDTQVLSDALEVVRTHISAFEAQITASIAAKTDPASGSATRENNSSTTFLKTQDPQSPGAVLRTIQVCCVVERGLEALINVLGMSDDREEQYEEAVEGKRDLMRSCVEKCNYVKVEMGNAIEGIKGAFALKSGSGGT